MPDLAPLLTPDPKELVDLVRALHADAAPWCPSGMGQHLHWGPPLSAQSTVLSLRRHNRVLEHAVGDFTVQVEAGLLLHTLQQALAEQGQWLPIDPPLAGDSSIGGVVARGLSGALRHRYMGLRDQLIGIGLLRSDGTRAQAGGRVVKNVAGYDLMRLLCGSWGSLALITSLTLRTQPLPRQRLQLQLSGSRTALQQLRQELLLRSPLAPERLCWCHQGQQSRLLLNLVGLNGAAVAAQQAQLNDLCGSAIEVEVIEPAQLQAPAVAADQWLLRLAVQPAQVVNLLEQQHGPWQLQLTAASGLGLARASGGDAMEHQVSLLRQQCDALGGFLTVLQSPQPCHLPAWGDAPHRPLIEALKRRFDPLQQLNRGRLPGVEPRQALSL